MKIEIGKAYKDGWGARHTIGGTTTVNPDWVYSLQGAWFRQSDGRFIAFALVDSTKPDGSRRHVASEKATYWDLKVDVS
jgi:hypothetical protein